VSTTFLRHLIFFLPPSPRRPHTHVRRCLHNRIALGAALVQRSIQKLGHSCVPTLATVFQAEVLAIHRCAETLLTRVDANYRYRICSDSRAALDALCKTATESSVVWDCMRALNRLGESHELILMWVPGHQDPWQRDRGQTGGTGNTYGTRHAGRRRSLRHGKKHHQRLVREGALKLLETDQRLQVV